MKYLLLFLGLIASTASYADYISNQKLTDADIKKELAMKKYSPDNPLILVNPYSISPLTALVSFSTEQPASVCVKVAGKDEETSLSHCFKDVSYDHLIPVYGLYVGNTVVLVSKLK